MKKKGAFSKWKPFCTSYPVYGTDGSTVGQEQGHIVQMTWCIRDLCYEFLQSSLLFILQNPP